MYYLTEDSVLKWLETPCVYNIRSDELYELDDYAFEFLKQCAAPGGCSDNADAVFVDYCISECILTAKPVSVRRPPILKSPTPSLRYLELQITDRCNLRCRHCYIGMPGNNELSVEAIVSVLREFEEMQGLRLLITGGEPLMHRHFDEINTLLPEYGFRKIVFTNGLLLDRGIMQRLNVDEIQFSVDGMEHGHDTIRGRGTYKTVMQKIKDALDSRIAVSIATMIHSENLNEFDEMQTLFRSIGIKDWTVDIPCVSGYFEDNPFLQVSPEIGGSYLNYGFGEGLHGGGEGFACGLHLMSALADGNICKCAFYSHTPVGNISEGLRKPWQRIMPVKLDELECSDISCRFIDECRGGCRFRAEDSRKKDLYKCCSYGIMKK